MKSASKIKPVAYYLPQYHQIPENDKWWGEGFTEWKNVKRGVPFFKGHHQPFVPYDYYDLSNESVMHRQITMAKKYKLHGFCFHYYWFSKKRLLEKPIEAFLNDKSPEADFPFMLCWANENWTRRWDGQDQDILIKQDHTPRDHAAVVKDLMRYMIDDRYIKVKNKPVLVLYRVNLIWLYPYFKLLLNQEAKKHGFDGVHIVATTAFSFKPWWGNDVDGVVQFPPHGPQYSEIFHHVVTTGFTNTEGYPLYTPEKFTQPHHGKIYDYSKTADAFTQYYSNVLNNSEIVNSKNYYPCCFPSWDNTARKMENAHVFANSSVEKFRQWLLAAAEFTYNNNDEDNSFLFINAWNEWAEGAMLEPDQTRGYKNLETVRDVMTMYQNS